MLSFLGRRVRNRDGLSRREVLRAGGLGCVGLVWPELLRARAQASTRAPAARTFGGARACILVFNYGGPSHIDTWDLKEGAWTPADFAPTSYGPVRFPQGLMPNTANQLGNNVSEFKLASGTLTAAQTTNAGTAPTGIVLH